MAGKERPSVPSIPGLHKGGIEARGEIWASRRRLGFSESRADLFIIHKDIESYLDLQVLGIPKSRPKSDEIPLERTKRIQSYPLWMPRVNLVTGEISITKWESPQTFNPDNFVAFGGKKFYEGVDLAGRPKSWKVAWLIPEGHETIQSAISAADKIARYEEATGPAQARVEELFVALRGLSEVFLYEEEISPLRLEGLSRQVESLLREHGLLRARDSIWKKIADKIQRAVSPVVRYGRPEVNKMISRILARATYLAVVHRELKQRAARAKALKLSFYLTEIQTEGVSVLENAEMFLDNLGGFAYAKPVHALSGEARWINPREFLAIKQAVLKLGNTLGDIEAAPYGPAARLAEAILVGKIGKSNEEIEELRQTLTERGRRELGRRSAVDYLMGLNGISARKRMFQAFNAIHGGLTPPKPKE